MWVLLDKMDKVLVKPFLPNLSLDLAFNFTNGKNILIDNQKFTLKAMWDD